MEQNFGTKEPLFLPDDLAHALGRQPLMGGDLVIGPALAQPSENAPRPQHPPMRGEPARERRRPFVNHACLAWPPAWRPLLTERTIVAWIVEIGKQFRGSRSLGRDRGLSKVST